MREVCFVWTCDKVEAVHSWKVLELTLLKTCFLANRALVSDMQIGYQRKVCVKGNSFRLKHILGRVFPVEEKR